MKVVLLSARNLEYYSPELFSHFDILLICTLKQAAQLPITIKPLFKEIAIVPEKFNPVSLVMELDEPAVIQLVSAIIKKEGATQVKICCSQEANLELGAYIRERFGLFGMDSATLLSFRDKIIMKQKLSKQHIRVPRFVEDVDFHLPVEKTYLSLREVLGTQFIIKPRNSVGSRSVYKIFTFADFSTFFEQHKNDSCNYEVEELIEGTLYHCDFALQKKQFYFQAASEYTWPNADFQQGKNLGSIPLLAGNATSQRLIAFGKEVLAVFDLPDGCFHMEIFISTINETVFLEVGARPPGLMGVPVYQKTFGINLYDIDFLIQIGEDVCTWLKVHQPKKVIPTSFIVFPKLTGTVNKLIEPLVNSQFNLEWLVKKGDIIGTTSSTNIEFSGQIVYWNENYEKLRSDFEYFKNKFTSIEYR